MKLITTLLAGLAVCIITLVVLAYVLDDTLLEADYISRQAERTDFYAGAASLLPELFAPRDLPAQVVLADLITPAYTQTQLDSFWQQLEAHYKQGGPVPRLDPLELVLKAESQGLSLPPELAQPIVYRVPPQAAVMRWLAGLVPFIKLAGPVAILVLVGILAVISASRYHAVAKVLALAALAQGGLYLIFKSLPGMLDPLMSAAQLGSFSPPLARLIQAISGDISGRFGWVGIGLLAAAVAVWLLGVMVGFSRRFIMPNPVEVRPTAGDRLRLN